MFAWWGRTVSRFRWLILVAAVGFVAFAAIWGTGVFGSLAEGGFDQPDSESQHARQRIEKEVGRQDLDLIALYSSDDLKVTDADFRESVVDVADRVRRDVGATTVISYYDTPAPSLISKDKHSTYLGIRLVDDPDTDTIRAVRDDLKAAGLTTKVGGPRAIFLDVNGQVSEDIARAEMISMPILLVLLVFVFGSVLAATTPLLIGGVAIIGAFTVVRVMTLFTDVSIFSINIITLLGLGLAIDYALFVVSRFREELDQGHTTSEALSRTMATAGRTVAVSGVTVALALSGLLIFPQMFLRSMGMGGVAAVAVAMLASLTVLQAIGTTTVLLVLASPFARVQFGGVDERVLPSGTESRVVSETLKEDFPDGDADPIRVLVSGSPAADAADFAQQIKNLDGVRDAVPTARQDDSTVITVTYDGASTSEQARNVVQDIRDLAEPAGADVLVGGQTANLVDLLKGLADRLPWMGLLVAAVTFVLLFLAFGSVVLPLKAIVMNLLSIGASFGAVVWIFQDGHLAGQLDFTSTGFLEATQPILMLALLFGLSMDYEVFLLSRVREQWDTLGDNTAAVASGVQRTGRIITAAALLLAVVVGAFATSGIVFIKMIGTGMLIAVLVDATLVRLLLVPATMRLVGPEVPPRPLRPLRHQGVRRDPNPTAPRPRTGRRPLTSPKSGLGVPAVGWQDPED